MNCLKYFNFFCLINFVRSCIPNSSNTGVVTICPSDWVSATFDSKTYCYLYVAQSATQSAAETYCNNATPGGHLVSIHDTTENDFVTSNYLRKNK